MIITKSYEISSCDDVELGIKRQSKLEFKLWYDDEKSPQALVFIIQGVGADCNDVHLDFMIQSLNKNFTLAFVGVNYHCIHHRPQTGSVFFMDAIDRLILKSSLEAARIKLPYDLEKIQNHEQLNELFSYINESLLRGKQEGRFLPSYFLNLHLSLQPAKNEYQNFGIMQAQDLLNAGLYLKKNAPFDTMGGVFPLSW